MTSGSQKILSELIPKYVTAKVKGFIEEANAIKPLKHNVTKGTFRELFLSNILKPFLSSQFGIGSGIIINNKGDQSKQTDIIIYDNTILPPFIKECITGVYPVESVMATIEVKSQLRSKYVLSAQCAAEELNELGEKEFKIFCAVFGLEGSIGNSNGKTWLKENAGNLMGICVVNKFFWCQLESKGWHPDSGNSQTNEETKAFIAVLLDNIRTFSWERTEKFKSKGHKDWFSMYIRD